MKKILIIAAFALVLAPPKLPATRAVSYTLQNAVRSDIQEIAISLDGAGVPVERVSYSLRDQNGAIVKTGDITLTLTAGQRTTLLSHIDSVVLPAINTAENL